MSCFVSIIIPVYNTEEYLPSCIDSVLNQSFKDFELILVDDGSTDGCSDICDAYAKRDRRIRVFHKINDGVSSARNLGLNYVSGEWIYFVDSDDVLLPDGLMTLVNCISAGVDIVMGGFIEVKESGEVVAVPENNEWMLSKRQSVVSLYSGYGYGYPYCGYLWMRLLRRSVIQRLNLRFDTSIAIKEDTLFLMQYICNSNGITRQTTVPVYQYCRRSESAMGRAERGFNLKYVDSFHALVKMKHEVDTIFSSYSTPVFIAKQAIFGRYQIVLDLMSKSLMQDDVLKSGLYATMRREVGSVFVFKVRRKLRKLFRNACKTSNNPKCDVQQ